MNYKVALQVIIYVTLLTVLPKAAAESSMINLKNNPFSRPLLEVEDTPPRQKVVRQAVPQKPVSIFIEATLVSENGSMVIANGKLITVGDKFEGMTLVDVREGVAIFRKGRKNRAFEVGVMAEK